MKNAPLMHGSTFTLLQRFVEKNYGRDVWENLLRKSGVGQKSYNAHQNYPLLEMEAIIGEASRITGLSEEVIKEKFGEGMVPDLMVLYKKYVEPEWKTFEMLLYTEHIMHKAVRKEESNANPPVLNVSRVHDKLLIIDYFSERRMGCLAVGIIKGIAKYYHEENKIKVESSSSPNDERVQIRIEFL